MSTPPAEKSFSTGKKALESIVPGKSAVAITLKPFDPSDELTSMQVCAAISYLCLMNGKNILITDPQVVPKLLSSVQSHCFENEEDRTIFAIVPDTFDPEWFADRTEYGIEKIVVTNSEDDPT